MAWHQPLPLVCVGQGFRRGRGVKGLCRGRGSAMVVFAVMGFRSWTFDIDYRLPYSYLSGDNYVLTNWSDSDHYPKGKVNDSR